MVKICFFILFSLWMVSEAVIAESQFSQKCFALDTNGTFCVNRVHQSKSKNILYFFHGLFMNAKDWPMAKVVYPLSKHWLDLKEKAPIVISISYGKFWLAVEKNSYRRSGLLEEIAEREIPKIEETIGLKPTDRILVGASMGGFNAAQLAIHYPKLFNRVALLCPAIINLSPRASMSETKQFQARANSEHAGVKRLSLEFYKFIARPFFPYEEDWMEDNIFNLIKKQKDPLPPFFVSTGSSDNYGFFYGSHNFVKIMKQQKRDIQWLPVNGTHCSFDNEAVQKFLYQELNMN